LPRERQLITGYVAKELEGLERNYGGEISRATASTP